MRLTSTRPLSILIGFFVALVMIEALTISGWAPIQTVSASPQVPLSGICNPGACQGTFYGTNSTWMKSATADWAQKANNWCGIANIEAIRRYDYKKYNGSNDTYSQQSIANDLNNSSIAISAWGHPSGSIFLANISKDAGTDPRAITWGAWYETPPGNYFHKYIYPNNNDQATRDFAYDFGANSNNPGTRNDPISVTISQGAHSFIIAGVYASADPSYGGSYTLYGIDTWDPWLNSSDKGFDGNKYFNQYQNTVWSFADWKSKQTSSNNPLGPSYLWAKPYSTTANHGYDPDPSAPNHYYDPPFPHYNNQQTHWGNFYITIEQDTITSYNFDYALDTNYHLVPHN